MSRSQPSTTLNRPEPGSSWAATIERLQSFVAARVGDRELAADLTQDVILRSIASGALDRVDNPSAWLYRSARNAVIDHYRTRRVHGPLPEPDQWPDPDLPGNEPNEATRELARCLQPLLSELPEHGTRRPDSCRPQRGDAPARRRRARDLGVRDEVTGAAGTPATQGPAHQLLRGRARPRRGRIGLPPR